MRNALSDENVDVANPSSPTSTESRILQKESVWFPCSVASISHVTNCANNIFFIAKFRDFYGLDSDVEKAIVDLITAILLMGTTITFFASILPAAVEHRYHSNRKINQFIKICKKAILFEIRSLSFEKIAQIIKDKRLLNEDEKRLYRIPIYIDADAVKEKFKIDDNEWKDIKEQIAEIALKRKKKYFEVVVIDNLDELKNPNNKYGYGKVDETVNLFYWGKKPDIPQKQEHPQEQKHPQNFNPIGIVSIDEGKLKRFYFEHSPFINTILSAILSVNHLGERFFGDSEKFSAGGLWTLEITALILALAKALTSFWRKFRKARIAWEELWYFLEHGRNHFPIHWWKFFLKVILPSLSAALTFMANSFFFIHNGAIDQTMELTCQLSKQCSHPFNTFKPDIPDWQYYIAYLLMFIAFGTVTFTQGLSSLEKYIRDILEKCIQDIKAGPGNKPLSLQDWFASMIKSMQRSTHQRNSHGYDLALKSAAELKPRTVEFACTEDGFEYRVIGLDREIKTATIPWEALPSEFPRDDNAVLAAKSELLLCILEVTSKEGHTPQNQKYATAWTVTLLGMKVDAFQMALNIFFGSATAAAYFINKFSDDEETAKDPAPISTGAALAFASTFSYFFFNSGFGWDKFTETYDSALELWRTTKNKLRSWWSCSFFSSSSPSETPLLSGPDNPCYVEEIGSSLDV